MRRQQRCPLTIHLNMWTVSSDVSLQRRHWQPPSIHLWAYCNPPSPWCEWCDAWRLTTKPGSTSPTLGDGWDGTYGFSSLSGLESQPFADVITKAALTSQLFKDPECWFSRGSNPWPPAQQTGALPTEPTRLLKRTERSLTCTYSKSSNGSTHKTFDFKCRQCFRDQNSVKPKTTGNRCAVTDRLYELKKTEECVRIFQSIKCLLWMTILVRYSS